MDRLGQALLFSVISFFSINSFGMTKQEYKEFYSKIESAVSDYDCETLNSIAEGLKKSKSDISYTNLLNAHIYLKAQCKWYEEDTYKYDESFGAQVLADVLENNISGEAIAFFRSLDEQQKHSVNYNPKKVADYLATAMENENNAEAISEAYWMYNLGDKYLPVDKDIHPYFTYPASEKKAWKAIDILIRLNHALGFQELGLFLISSKAAKLGKFNRKKSFYNLKKAADLGSKEAAFEVARFYQSSYLMRKANYKLALEYIEKSLDGYWLEEHSIAEGYRKMLNCNQAAKLKVMRLKFACITRSQAREKLEQQNIFVFRENDDYLADIYRSDEVMMDTLTMSLLYTNGGELAKAIFELKPGANYDELLKYINLATGESQERGGSGTWWHPENETNLRVYLGGGKLIFENTLQTTELERHWKFQELEKTSNSMQGL